MKKTKIVATVGPACRIDRTLKGLIRAGVDVFRINTSHTQPEDLREWIVRIRRTAKSVGKEVGILVDLQGPRIRTGKLRGGKPVELRTGEKAVIEVGNGEGTAQCIKTTCRELPGMLKKNDRILLDNGLMELVVLKASRHLVECKVVRGGTLGENKGINLPCVKVNLPVLNPKDLASLRMAVRMKADYIALSFVRSEKDVETVKDWLLRHRSSIPLIAKIEKPAAVDDIDDILKHADAIMVARGDLGIEVGVEKVPTIQKHLIQKANRMRVPVITATQMLESMMTQVYPTRAEASDIANAVLDGTDAVMLSGETASGKYPVEAVKMMSRIIDETEKIVPHRSFELARQCFAREDLPLYAVTHAACDAVVRLQSKNLVVFTQTGKTALFVSKLRPDAAIFAMTPHEEVVRRLMLFHGVQPFRMPFVRDTDEMIRVGGKILRAKVPHRKGDTAVVVSGRHEPRDARYMMKIYQAE